jgi:flagellum-specific peptidoglycan hydrolase FlgJ
MMTFPTPDHIAAAQKAADAWFTQRHVYIWPSVTLAQACIESADWTKLTGKNNGFGIKATQQQIREGKADFVWTHEYRNGHAYKTRQWFADFDTIDEAYHEHARVLATLKVYAAAHQAPDAEAFIKAIAPHYATAPDYAQVIIRTMTTLDLYSYDKPKSVPV